MNDPAEIRRRVLEAIYDHDHAPEEEKDAYRRRLNEALDEAARAAPGN